MAAPFALEAGFPVSVGGVILVLAALLLGCSGGMGTSGLGAGGSAACPTNVAQILVFDNLLQTSCGCQEGAGITANPPQPLNCTIASGTTVFFQYIGPGLTHQISPTNGTAFPVSPPFIPSAGPPVSTFTVVFNTAGSFPFVDLYDTGMNGVIIVQ